MDEFKWGYKLAVNATKDLVDHVCGVKYFKVQVILTNLLFGDVGPSHLYDGVPSPFSQTIGRLAARVSSNEQALVCERALSPMSFLLKSV